MVDNVISVSGILVSVWCESEQVYQYDLIGRSCIYKIENIQVAANFMCSNTSSESFRDTSDPLIGVWGVLGSSLLNHYS